MESVRISRTRTLLNAAIFAIGALAIAAVVLPSLVTRGMPPRSLYGWLELTGLIAGSGFCLAIVISQLRVALDRRPGLAIIGDRMSIHPFWMTERSVALDRIERVTFEQYEFFVKNTTNAQRHRLRIDLKPGAGNGRPLLFETWRLAGGDAAGREFGAALARHAGLTLETAIG